MLSTFEELVLTIAIPLIALFVSKFYTYEFSTPKFFILALFSFLTTLYLLLRSLYMIVKKPVKSAHSTPDIVPFSVSLSFTSVHILWFFYGFITLFSLFNVWRDNPFFLRWSFDISLYLLVNILISFYFTNKMTDKKNILWYAFLFLLPGFYIATSSTINFYTGFDPLLGKLGEPFIRGTIRSTVGNVIFVANYLNMLFPLTVYFVMSKDYSFFRKNVFWKVFMVKLTALLASLFILVVLSIAQTRSEIIALSTGIVIFSGFYFLFIQRKPVHDEDKCSPQEKARLNKLTNVMTILLFALGITVFLLFNFSPKLIGNTTGTIIARFSGETWSSSKDERFLSWLSSIPIWKKHKVLGQGIGTYRIYDLYGVQEVLKEHPEYNYVWNNFKKTHNEYLQQLAETGLLGFSVLLVMLILLSVYVFRNIIALDNRDDALLFTTFVVSGVVFALQCVFSFPAQILPNALAANYFISVGLGVYFNKTMMKKLNIKYPTAILLLIIVTVVTGLSTYLRYTHFWAEVYGKSGMESYTNYYNYSTQYPQYISQIENLKKLEDDINNLSGQFSFLRPENWHTQKQNEARRTGIPYSQINAEAQRVQTIHNIKSQIENQKVSIERQIRLLEAEIPSLFYDAQRNLIKSVKYDPTFGKAHFYLAALAADERRIQVLNSQIQLEPSIPLSQEYDEYQEFIAPQYKYRYLEFLSDFLKKTPQMSIYLRVPEAQAVIDSIGLYETSLQFFSERNTYKSLAQRYAQLASYMRYMSQILTGKEFQEKFNKLFDESVDKYINWTIATLTLKPGSWMKFPDWRSVDIELAFQGRDVYKLLPGLAFELLPATDTRVEKLLENAGRIEVTASINMDKKNYWGVPDGSFDLYATVALKSNDGKVKAKVLEIYKPAYDYLKEKLSKMDFKAIYEERTKFILNDVRRILEKENQASMETILAQLDSSLKRAFDKFINEDYEKIQKDYFETLLANDSRNWARIGKKSVWKQAFNNAFADFRNSLANQKISEDSKNQINTLLNYLVDSNLDNNNMMFAYERYMLFIKGYELLANKN